MMTQGGSVKRRMKKRTTNDLFCSATISIPKTTLVPWPAPLLRVNVVIGGLAMP